MTVKILPERRGIVEGPFMYPDWQRNYCKRCDLEIGAYYICYQNYPPFRGCLKCATKRAQEKQP